MIKQKSEERIIDERDRKELVATLRDRTAAMADHRLRGIREAAEKASKEDYFLNRNFYVVLVKTNKRTELREPVDMHFCRRSCPTPGYNQDVFKYHTVSGELEYLWSIPRKARYYEIWNNRLKYLYNPETKRLATFVIAMESGDLMKWVKKENGEKQDAVIKINKKIEA